MRMNCVKCLFSFIILSLCAQGLIAAEIVLRDEYLAYAKASAEYTYAHYDELIERWRNGFDPENVFGYRAPGGLLEMAVIYAYFYERDKVQEYADRAKGVLLTYGDFRSQYPDYARERRADYAAGVPALPDFFTVMRYIRAYETLLRFEQFTAAEKTKIERIIEESLDYLLRTQEWGPMNRTILRAETLAWATGTLVDHAKRPMWDMLRVSLADDNWGNWEIEDATIYHAVWLYSLIGYADALGKVDELFATPEMYYYAHYFLELMSPAGMIPDFGDAAWQQNWNRYLVFFETAAAQYKNPQMKWAATVIARKFIDFDAPTSVGLGYLLLDCYRWGDDSVPAEAPTSGSKEVMEDVQGKKVVFRNGWDERATYLLLNYRDEGDGGLNFRDYLRDTIPVEEEKMTHGHADENGIVLLMSGGSVLLHDGGYRDYMPSGPYGAYRQDYFHNKLCVRAEKIWMGQNEGEYRYSVAGRVAVPGQPVLEFLRNAGSYRRVRTRKVDFISLPDFDYSRTRVIDDNMGYEHDRVIAYLKGPDLFVVFDIFKSRVEEYFTLANLWHTRKIFSQGEHWYDTGYDRIQNHELSQEKRLLIIFPRTHYRLEGVEEETRHYQDELLIHRTTAQHFELGETVGFITVLLPHEADEPVRDWLNAVELLSVTPEKAGMGVTLKVGESEYSVAVKNDLRMDITRDWRRPRYTYKSGKINYGDLETNGDFAYTAIKDGTLAYTVVNLSKIFFRGQLLFEAKPSLYGLAFDGSRDAAGTGKLRYWRDEVTEKLK